METGKCLLFVGAGFSFGATNLKNEPIVSAAGLSEILLNACGTTDKSGYDLDTAADEYVDRFGDDSLVALLHQNFTSKDPTADQNTIICQPWHRIYTTNYDDLIEKIAHTQNKPLTVKEISDPVEPPLLGVTQLIHIYGNISRASPAEFKSKFLLTERQRDNSAFLNSPWKWRFNDDVLAAQAVVFVGFSMSDIDLRRLLGQLPPQVQEKTYFFDVPQIPIPIMKRLSRFGQLELIGASGLATSLGEKRVGPAVASTKFVPSSVDEIQFELRGSRDDISQPDIEKLLITGVLQEKKFSQRDIDGSPGSYTIKRGDNHLRRATSSARPVLIHSDIGNGKSVFAMQVAIDRCVSGGQAFRLRREPEQIGEVISYFQSLDTRAVIVADDIMKFPTLVRKLIDLRKSNLSIITTVRSNILEAARSLVETRIGPTSFTEIDLNISSPDEVRRISSYLDENGLWGSFAEFNATEKADFIAQKCGGQLRDIILSLFEQGSLHERVTSLVEAIGDLDPFVYRLLVLSALLTVAGHDEFDRFYIIADLVEYNGSYEDIRDALRKNGILGLIKIEGGEIGFRSPAFAEFLLRKSVGLVRALDVAKLALFHLDKFFSDDYEFDRANRALLKFSLYRRIFKENNLEERMEGFYDECRALGIAKRDPLFLVQRSITNMSAGRFSTSKMFIETAYAMAKSKRGFDTYQIDTHFAKLLLTESLRDGFSRNFERETKAHDLVQAVLARRKNDLYHPLSVLRLDGDLVKKWRPEMNSGERKQMATLIGRGSQLLNGFPDHQKNRHRSFSSVKQILDRAKKELS